MSERPRWATWVTRISLAVAIVALVFTIRDVGLRTLGGYLRRIGWWWVAIVALEVLNTTLHSTALRAFAAPDASVRNPVDLVAGASAADFERALRVVLADNAVDAVIAIFVPPLVTEASDVARAIAAATADPHDKTVVACFLGRILAYDGAALFAPRFLEGAKSAKRTGVVYRSHETIACGAVTQMLPHQLQARFVLPVAVEARDEGLSEDRII
jgi:hypothetical protein